MTPLIINKLFLLVGEARTERVLWIDPLGRGCFTIDIDAGSAMPVFRRSEEFERLLADGLLEDVADDPWLAPLSEASIPEGHRARRDASWALIRPLVLDQPAIFHPDKRGGLVQCAVAASGISRYGIYRLLRRYWQRGMTPNAVLPDYDRCGGRGKDKAVSEKKRGRVSATGIAGINVDAGMRQLFRDTVTRYFAGNRQLSLNGCYDELIDANYTDLVIDEETGQQRGIVRAPYPTLRQFRYWYDKDNDVFDLERQRRTPRVPTAPTPRAGT